VVPPRPVFIWFPDFKGSARGGATLGLQTHGARADKGVPSKAYVSFRCTRKSASMGAGSRALRVVMGVSSARQCPSVSREWWQGSVPSGHFLKQTVKSTKGKIDV
jgi:hypothetical protein